MGKKAACVVTPGRRGTITSYDRVLASCSIEGSSLVALMRGVGVVEDGNKRRSTMRYPVTLHPTQKLY